MSVLNSYSLTNVPEIDMQHQNLFICLNDLNTVIDSWDSVTEADVEHALNFLDAYLVRHFDDEEELQRAYQYPQRKWHAEMHHWYIAEFHKMRNEYMQNGASEEFAQRLADSVSNWIVKHINNVDVKLGEYIKKQRHGIKR